MPEDSLVRQPPSATFNQKAPRRSEWPTAVDPYRDDLISRLDKVNERINDLNRRYDEYADQAGTELGELESKIPDVGEDPTEVEWLTRRIAQAARDLTQAQHEVKAQEVWVERQKLDCESAELAFRIGQIDDLLENGAYAAGNGPQIEWLLLDVEQAGAERAHAVAMVSRRKLGVANRLQREINAELRRVQRASPRRR